MTGTVWRDAFRSLRRDRWFSGVAVLLLAVTIGALTAVYAVVQALVLRPFPFRDQDRVVMAWQRDDRRALPVIDRIRWSPGPSGSWSPGPSGPGYAL